MRRTGIRVAGVATAGLLVGGLYAVTGAAQAGAEPATQQFSFTGASDSFTVPANVCRVTVDAFGAEGASAPGGTDGMIPSAAQTNAAAAAAGGDVGAQQAPASTPAASAGTPLRPST
jgi:hypothetical protein